MLVSKPGNQHHKAILRYCRCHESRYATRKDTNLFTFIIIIIDHNLTESVTLRNDIYWLN